MRAITLQRGRSAGTAACVAAVLWAASGVGPLVAGAQDGRPPNIVVIMADDLTVRQFEAFMPKTRALIGSAGVSYTNSIVTFPECCPSRATFLTGQYSHNHGVQSGNPPTGGYRRLDHTNTLATWLDSAGYHTAHVGKYLNGYGAQAPPDVPPGWDEWFGLVDPASGFAYETRIYDDGQLRQLRAVSRQHRSTVLRAEALATVERAVATGDPFFLNFATPDPHLSVRDHEPWSGLAGAPVSSIMDLPEGHGYIAPDRYEGRLSGRPVAWPPNFDEADVTDKPAASRRPALTSEERSREAELWNEAGETLLALDDTVAALVTSLGDLGVLDNTVIIFTSDNGVYFGEHRIQFGKFLPYEEAVRVPLLVRGPGFPAGTVEARPVANIDLAPTIASLAGAQPMRQLDGIDLRVLGGDPDAHRDRPLLIEGGPLWGRPYFHGIWTPERVYIRYTTGDEEMYDLVTDPYQLDNLAEAPGWAAARAEMAALTLALRRCRGDGCRTPVSGPAPPVAEAGADLVVVPGGTIFLVGGGSFDPDGGELTFHWEHLGGGNPGIMFASNPTALAAAPVNPTTVTYRLTVTDDEGFSASDEMAVTVNSAPVAEAGADQVLAPGSSAVLDGRASLDVEGDQLAYQWMEVSGPPVTFSRPLSAASGVRLIEPGEYTFRLAVSDPFGRESYSFTTITVAP